MRRDLTEDEYTEFAKVARPSASTAHVHAASPLHRPHVARPHIPAADCSLRQDFAALYTNGNSVLDPSEIRAVLEKQVGRAPTDQQFEYCMADIDVDKDGTVSCDEYIANIFDDKAFLVDGKPHEYRTRGCRIPRTEHRASTVRQLCRSAVALRASGGPLLLPVRAAVALWLS